VALDVTYGNIGEHTANWLAAAAGSVDDVPHEPGCTEPWISRLVSDFIVARGAHSVLETGCFKGATSVWIYDALRRLGGGLFVYCDIDPDRLDATSERILAIREARHNVRLMRTGDILRYLEPLPPGVAEVRFDLAWVDDCHEKPHVTKELTLLYPKMNKGGLILLHDVFGVCDLKTVVQQFGGYSIDLPRLGPAGGLGIIQC
jgi:predicted O-methyltransferase YrrM